MAYDKGLEVRIDEITEGWEHYEKKKMFGGICYLKSGNMAMGIWHDYLIVRCGASRHRECLQQKNTKEFDVTGKSMAGWVMVYPAGVEEDTELEKWIRIGDDYSSSLPPKKGK
jgi:TfoX/Sxy family transcriptional regulator of competence genes